MTTFGQSCTYYISLFNFIKMFFRLIGVHISFCGKNSFLTYFYIQFRTEFFPTKQPLIPRLARKNKGAVPGPYLVCGCTILPERMSVYSPVSD